MHGSLAYVHTLCIFPEFFDVFFADLFVCQTFFVCTADDFVVNICEVLYKLNVITSVFHITAQYVKYAERSCVTDVDKVVNCRAASVNLEYARLYCFEFLLCACESVENFHLFFLLF